MSVNVITRQCSLDWCSITVEDPWPYRRCRKHRSSCAVKGCATIPKQNQNGNFNKLCAKHHARKARKRPIEDSEYVKDGPSPWFIDTRGYVARYVRRKNNQGKMVVNETQHRVVMEEYLGRKLSQGENVHHKNGDRADNRIQNLELWSTRQPAGQRVVDKVAWAKELLAMYPDDVVEKLERLT